MSVLGKPCIFLFWGEAWELRSRLSDPCRRSGPLQGATFCVISNSGTVRARARNWRAIIDIEELNRIEEILEDSSDLKVINESVAEPAEDYEVYSRKRKARLCV
jgi:hypothetical protein